MTATVQKEPAEVLNLDISLDRTTRPESESSDLLWDGDMLKWVGMWQVDCSAFNVLESETQRSLREHLIPFAKQRKYSMGTFRGIVQAFTYSLAQHPTSGFDMRWLAKAITVRSVAIHIGGIRSFFIYWQERHPQAITSDALQFLARPHRRGNNGKNVLSDDPKKSWLTDMEYDAVLRRVWDNYDQAITEIQITLMRLLALQYARRPVQLAHLKIGDFREGPAKEGGTGGRRIHFPGAKDKGAEENFRDSKEEVHPVGDHIWDLFHIRKHEVKALFEKKLDRMLTEQELAQLPIFTTEAQLEQAIEVLTNHYRIDWRAKLSDRIFHVKSFTVGKVLRWLSNKMGDNSDKEQKPSPPLSHRTGKPIKISATRMRHTRARQLARLGTPKHVLSFWLGHESEKTLDSYYNDPAEEARQINAAMKGALVPLAMAFTGKLLDDESQSTRANDPESTLEFAVDGNLKNVGKCGKHSFCATTSVPIPCYRCKMFEPMVYAPHEEVLLALLKRQVEEDAMIKIGGNRRLLTPIDLGPDIRAVQACIARCNARKAELEINHD
jgi:integrase